MCTKAFSRQLIMFAGMLIVECCNEMRWQKMVAVGLLLHGMSDITPTSLKPSWLSAFFNWRSCRQYHRVLSPALRWHKKNYNYWMQVNKLIESGLLKIAAISLTTKRREVRCRCVWPRQWINHHFVDKHHPPKQQNNSSKYSRMYRELRSPWSACRTPFKSPSINQWLSIAYQQANQRRKH